MLYLLAVVLSAGRGPLQAGSAVPAGCPCCWSSPGTGTVGRPAHPPSVACEKHSFNNESPSAESPFIILRSLPLHGRGVGFYHQIWLGNTDGEKKRTKNRKRNVGQSNIEPTVEILYLEGKQYPTTPPPSHRLLWMCVRGCICKSWDLTFDQRWNSCLSLSDDLEAAIKI